MTYKKFFAFLLVFMATAVRASDTRVLHADQVDLQNSGHVSLFEAGTLFGDTTFKLPADNGTSGYCLSTDGSGVTSWLSVAPSTRTINTTSPLAGGGPLSSDLTLTLGTVPIAKGGTNSTTKSGAFDSLSPMSAAGDVIYGGTSGTGTALAHGTSVQVLHSGTTPSWSAVSLTADVTGTLPVANGGTGGTSSTGSGAVVLASSPTITSPVLITPALGTPASGVLTNATGLPLTSGVTGVLPIANGGTNGATKSAAYDSLSPLAAAGDLVYGGVSGTGTALTKGTAVQLLHSGTTPSWSAVSMTADVTGTLPVANGGTGATSSTGSGAVVLASAPTIASPILTTPALGTPASGVLTNATGLPLTSGVTGTLPIANGGTNGVTKAASFDNLSPMSAAGDVIYGGTSGTGTTLAKGTTVQLLHSGTTPTWSAVSLTADVSGTLPIANGGTGQTSANNALNAFLPSQTGNNSKVLTTDGSNTSWAAGLTTSLTSAHLFIGNVSNIATDTAVTGDITIDNGGVTAIGSGKVTSTMIADGTIVDADINASAAITGTKIQAAASSTTGVVNATTQTLTGVKTFETGIKLGTSTTTLSNYAEGNFTATLTGCTATVTGTVNYVVVGKAVTIFVPAITCTSNTTGLGFTGLPAAIQTTTEQRGPAFVSDNSGSTTFGRVKISGSAVNFDNGTSLGSFTASGTKGTNTFDFTYTLF